MSIKYKSDVRHILDAPAAAPDGPVLVFRAELDSTTGGFDEGNSQSLERKTLTALQPEDWDHVRHLACNLYYAWDEGKPAGGTVYVGEFVDLLEDSK